MMIFNGRGTRRWMPVGLVGTRENVKVVVDLEIQRAAAKIAAMHRAVALQVAALVLEPLADQQAVDQLVAAVILAGGEGTLQ